MSQTSAGGAHEHHLCQASPALPAYGSPTLVQKATAAGLFMDATATTYDTYGRAATETRTPKTTAQTVYTRRTPATGALPTAVTAVTQVTAGADCSAVTTSSADCQVVTQTLDAARQLPITKTDEAGGLSSLTYDALGRLTAVWLPNKSRSAGAAANMTYGYSLSTTGPNVVTTNTLRDNGDGETTAHYLTSKVLHDAMLREIESQRTAENGTISVTDTQYDSHGWKVLTNDAYATATTPSDALVSDRLSQVSVPATTVTDHDGMARVTQVTSEHNGAATRRTRTAYTGDRTTELPPTGSVAVTKVADARGQLTQLQQYTAAPTLSGTVTGGFTASGGTSQSIAYGFTAAGQQSSVTGPDGAVWSFKYDLLGRETSRTDPDAGVQLTAFDDAGNVITSRDARGVLLDFTYDLLGRKLTATDRSKSNFKYASWTYDTLRIGKLTSSTRYVPDVTGGYTVAIDGYTALGKSLGQTITLPTVEKPLPISYSTSFRYSSETELLAGQTDPAVGGLPGETITYSRDLLGVPTRTAGIDQYVSGSAYTDFGRPSRITVGASSNQAEVMYSYEDETLRLSGRTVSRSQGIGPVVDTTTYAYDDAGNPLSVTDVQSESGNNLTDRQCYRYDALTRLADARTVSGDCSAGAVSTGAGAYWQSFEYDSIGDRTKLIDHATGSGSDVTTSFTNGCSASCNRTGAQPHTLTATTGGADPTGFVYDVAGNLLTRTATSGKNQTLSWDDEGSLAAVTTTAGTTKYLYDADGNQLIRRDPGRTTLFAGDTQIVVDTASASVRGAVRTYAHGGDGPAIAVRSTLPGGGTSYLFNDPNATATLSMDTTTQEVSRKQYKPYGETRSSTNAAAWPDLTHGYLGLAEDLTTGYTDMGARKYDPALGRFLSVDPVLEMTDPNQLGGYAYAGSNPISRSDPSGKMFPMEERGDTGSAIPSGRGGDSGSGGDTGGGGGGGKKCSGRYCVGSPKEPTQPSGADDDFKYDPKEKATWRDHWNWAKWGGMMLLCDGSAILNVSKCGDMHQAPDFYAHYRDGDGDPMEFDYDAGYKQDDSIRQDVNREISQAQRAAEALAKDQGSNFGITGKSRQNSLYPNTYEWQKVIGSYNIWSSADVHVKGNQIYMRIRVNAYDRYNFNRGAGDIQTGKPDDANGRFAVIGWAKGFNSSGYVQRDVYWTIGSPNGAYVRNSPTR
ncbi:RHS repeat-associated core domain-containing protein [Actinoplanes sp. NPDC026619]|uniref:RHS repeat-associated core domain-containing protein n=1 Tax=Actinoplanes sp. NPDC026619 TaxID=3155798 RepID=UPI0033EBB4B4